ncbi:MAG: tetratricopeptide repeat protein [Thermoanaerobaculia bacterium]
MRAGTIGLLLGFAAVSSFAEPPQATALFEQGRYEEARRMLTPLHDDPGALFLLGRIAIAEDDNEKAVALLEKAIEKKPNVAGYHYYLGDAYGNLAQHASIFKQPGYALKTRNAFERAVALDPNYVPARFALIDYYTLAPSIMGGSEEKAKQQAAEIGKRDAFQGHRALARIYTRQKKLDLARNEFQTAVREQPAAARPHTTLASFYALNDKNYPAAFEQIDAAIVADPTYMPSYFRLGQIAAMSTSNLPRGEEALKKYLTYLPKDDEPSLASTYYYLGMIYEKQGHKNEARQSYSNALRFAPKEKTYLDAMKRVS